MSTLSRVNIRSHFGCNVEMPVRVLGVDLLLECAAHASDTDASAIWAWLKHVRERNWRTSEEVRADYSGAELRLPSATFRLVSRPIRIESLIDFRCGVVVVTEVKVDVRAAA